MRLKTLLFSILYSISIFGFAQSEVEKVSFDIPKTIFFTDEKIWIKGEVLSEDSPSDSRILYAELLDSENKSWEISKMPLEDGKVFNYLELTEQIPSGNYVLRVFTRISPYLDLEQGISQKFVTILNPSMPPKVSEREPKRRSFSSETGSPVTLSKSNLTQNEAADLTLNLPASRLTSVRLSVANPYLIGDEADLNSAEIYESIEEGIILPELFGHIIHGKLNSEKIDTTKTYFLSVHGEQSALYTDRPDLEGNLYFDLGGFRHWDHILIQVEDGSSMLEFEVQSPAPNTKFHSQFEIPELVISKSDEEFLENLKFAAALEPYFTQEFRNEPIPVVTGFVADQVFLLDDFTRFDDVETVIKEYVPNVAIRRINRLKEFRLINVPANFVFPSNPLMMVDAMPVFDSNMLIEFDPKFFSKLEVLNREFYLNDKSYNGVLSFSSYENNFGLFPIPNEVLYLDYSGVQAHVSFEKPIYSPANSQENAYPDFRSVLFWYTQGIDSFQEKYSVFTSGFSGSYLLEVDYRNENGQAQTWTKEVIVE